MPHELASRFQSIRDRIAHAADSVGRDPESVTLVAVSKTFPTEAIQTAYDLGLRHFGESRLQEALPKIEALPDDIIWHFIGNLQSNKARRIAETFHVIHTVDSASQLREIAKCRAPRNPEGAIDVFVEVNVANEPQKSGVSLPSLDTFLPNVLESDVTRFRGLMTIGPAGTSPEQMRSYFRQLREANAKVHGSWLSMGMSGDFDVAIQEGSTHVRVGSALFGER